MRFWICTIVRQYHSTMKSKLIIAALLLPSTLFSQYNTLQPNNDLLEGGFGLTWINGAPNYAFRFAPEFQFSNIGIGLDLNLEYTSAGRLRAENFNEFSDYLSVIRYIRYGQKNDPLYIKLGAVDYASLGHGSIMYLYNNSPSFDNRKTGLELDADFNNYGFESVYGNFGQSGVIGLRGYFKPLQSTKLASLPVIGKIETGITIASDLNPDAGVIAGNYNAATNVFLPTMDEVNITLLGIDLGLPLLRTDIANLDAYIDYAKIVKFGSGIATGLSLNFNGFGLLRLRAKLERRFNGDHYIPSYFDPLYEIERFSLNKENAIVVSKVQQLKTAVDQHNGYFGELFSSLMGIFNAVGNYQKLDDSPNSGILHVAGEISNEKFPYVVRVSYDKINIENFRDLFTTDDRSYLYVEFGYKIEKYLLLSMIYFWTFTPVRDYNDNIIGYTPQKRVEPRLSFIYPFN